MILDISVAFLSGRRGLSVWRIDTGYQVGVKGADGAFSVGYGDTPQSALNDALGLRTPAMDNTDLL